MESTHAALPEPVSLPAPSRPRRDDLVGRILARTYRLDAVIGKGAMGTVYRATHITDPDPVAVKVLAPEKAKDAAHLRRFWLEGELAMRIDHPGSVRVLEMGEHEGLWFLAMELVEGRTLKKLIAEEGPLEPLRALRYTLQVLDAVEAAHAAGVVHRDLKPANVMVDERLRGRARLLDFGVAKETGPRRGETALTLPGTVFGSPSYMSPEQVRGVELDARSDVYSAGVLLLELLLGTNPFRGFGLDDTIVRVIAHPPPRLAEVRPDAPAGLDEVLQRALAKDRERRYPSAAAFQDALQRVLEDEELSRVSCVFAAG